MQEQKILEVCEFYCGNGMVLLKRICDPMIHKFGGLTESEYDDFYSIANATVWVAAMKFDEGVNDSFDNYLRSCIYKKFKTRMTKKNRRKRIPTNLIDCIDLPINESNDRTYAEVIGSGYDILDDIKEFQDNGLEMFKANLSKLQKKIVDLMIMGFEKEEIKKILNITDRKYETCVGRMKTYENQILLSGKFEE